MDQFVKILMLEDNIDDAELIFAELETHFTNHEIKRVSNKKKFEQEAIKFSPNIILADYSLPQYSGLEALRFIKAKGLSTPFIFVTGAQDEETAANCIKEGAWDYISKAHLMRVGPTVKHAIETRTEQKKQRKTEAALKATEERLIRFMESATDSIALYDENMQVVLFNDVAEKLFCMSKESLGKHITDISPSVIPSKRYDAYLKVLKTGIPIVFDDVLDHPELGKIDLQFKAFKVGDGIGLIVTDISDRKRTEEKLRESEEKFRELTEMLPESVFETDRGGNITFANPTLCKKFGYAHHELVERMNLMRLISPQDRTRAVKEYIHFLSGEELSSAEYLAQKSDGSFFPVMLSMSPISRNSEQKTLGMRGIIVDLTEQKEAEKEHSRLEIQLRQAQKMETIGTLAGGIAHDFNNILTPILGFTEIIQEELPLNSHLRNNIDQIQKAARRASDLVKQILTFSRLTENERKPIFLAPIIKEASKLLNSSLPRNIELSYKIESDNYVVEADPTQIHQVIMNLCVNAYHAIRPENGKIKVQLENINITKNMLKDFTGLQSGQHVHLSVQDTGTGIPEDIIDRIFDPFFTTKKENQGTGMGLAAVHGIVLNHGGEITVETELDVGSTFHIYLPCQVKMTEHAQPKTPKPPSGSETILVVDDEEEIVSLTTQMLERLGYQVVGKTNSVEALNEFKENPKKFDLVITDQSMPNMTGLKISEEMLAKRPELPIILCTGFSDVATPEKVAETGIREFVMKPISMHNMAQLIRQVLQKD